LTECIDTMLEDNGCDCDLALLPLACNSPDDLCLKLIELQKKLKSPNGIKNIWNDAWKEYKATHMLSSYTAVLAFDSKDGLDKEIVSLLSAVGNLDGSKNFNSDFRYESTQGSHFTAAPYGKDAKVVYMNPPGSAQYLLLFFEMLALFPSYRNRYANFLNSKFFSEIDKMDFRFGRFAIEMCMIGIVNTIARERLGLSPHILTGASLGEIASLFSYDCIDHNLEGGHDQSTLKLLKAFNEVYTYRSYDMTIRYIKAPLTAIREALIGSHWENDIYILLEASPGGAFISGRPEKIQLMLEETGFINWVLDLNSHVHTPILDQFYEYLYNTAIECKNTFKPDLDVQIYSAYYRKPVENTVEAIAEYAASVLIKPCYFYGLLELVYERGSRVFVDMGTGGSCLAWAQETFADRDTLCFSIYPSFVNSKTSILLTSAKLISNRVNIDLDALVNSFKHSFMESCEDFNSVATVVEPLEKSQDAALTPKPVTSDNVQSNVQRTVFGVPKYRHKGFYNNAYAYSLYLENEKLLLAKIRQMQQKSKAYVWDYHDILEITGGAPSKIWGKRYSSLDSLTKRARMPLPPFMFVTRIINIDAEFGEFKPSSIEIELDITDDCIMMMSPSTISYVLLTESSHVAIFLLAYIGIDLLYDGEVSYRILNTQEALHSDFPIKGDTIRAKLEFVEFTKNGSTTLIKSKFICHKKDELLMTMDLMGGFFTEDELRNTKGILPSIKPNLKKVKPLLTKMKPLKNLKLDLDAFYNGKYGAKIYPTRTSAEAEYLYVHPKIRMLDRVTTVDFEGGDYGLGLIVAEKDVSENHWSFDVHFKNDPVFPGSLLAEAGNHIQLVFALNAGYIGDGNYILRCKNGLLIKSVFRGQVRRVESVLRFEQHFKEITETDTGVIIVSDSNVFWQGSHISRTENLSLVIEQR